MPLEIRVKVASFVGRNMNLDLRVQLRFDESNQPRIGDSKMLHALTGSMAFNGELAHVLNQIDHIGEVIVELDF